MGTAFHALFDPPENDAVKRDLHWVCVMRRDVATGQYVTSPTPHTVDDFPSLAALQSLYGGGDFRLFARDVGNKRITARKDWKLPGPPLPFPGELPPPAPAPPAQPPPPPHGTDPMIAMMIESSRMNSQMMAMMMQTSSQQSQAQMQAMAQMMGAMMSTVAGLLRPNDSAGALKDGLQMGMQLMGEARAAEPAAAPADDDDPITATIGAIAGGIGAAVAEKITSDARDARATPPAGADSPHAASPAPAATA